MESMSYVLSFRMVFFYLVITGWIFDISLCENSISQSINQSIINQGSNNLFHRFVQSKVQKKINRAQRKSQHLRKNMQQVPKNDKFRKTRSRLGQQNPKRK